MDDRMLTRLLDASAPDTTETVERDTALTALVSERAPRRRGRPVAAVVGIAGALVLAGGTAAAAGPALLTHLGWGADVTATQVTTSGVTCVHGFRVTATPGSNPSAEAIDVARDALHATDIESLDLSETLTWLEPEIANRVSGDGGDLWEPTQAYMENFALGITLNDVVADAITAAGFDAAMIEVAGGSECDGDLIDYLDR